MKTENLLKNLVYKEEKVNVEVVFETSFSKEIRITMRAGQEMKEHKAPSAIVVELFEGEVEFGVGGEVLSLKRGDILTLEGNVPHDLKALKDSIVRLSIAKLDKVERVEGVAEMK